MKNLLPLIVFLVFLILPKMSYAQYQVTQQLNRQIMIDKKIFHPQLNSYVDNLSVDQFLFLQDQEVSFRIEVKNVTTSEIRSLEVKDRLPKEVTFLAGPGRYNPSDHSMEFTIDILAPGQSRNFDIKARINSIDNSMANILCVNNIAELKFNKSFDQDVVNFCIQRNVLGVTFELPRTGMTNSILIGLVGLGMLGLSGYFFKKSRFKEAN